MIISRTACRESVFSSSDIKKKEKGNNIKISFVPSVLMRGNAVPWSASALYGQRKSKTSQVDHFLSVLVLAADGKKQSPAPAVGAKREPSRSISTGS